MILKFKNELCWNLLSRPPSSVDPVLPLLVSCGSGSTLRGVGTVWWEPPKGLRTIVGMLCSALGMSDSTAVHETAMVCQVTLWVWQVQL